MGFNQKLSTILKENWNEEQGPTLTKGLLLFISIIKILRANLALRAPKDIVHRLSYPEAFARAIWHFVNASAASPVFPEELQLSLSSLHSSKSQNKPGHLIHMQAWTHSLFPHPSSALGSTKYPAVLQEWTFKLKFSEPHWLRLSSSAWWLASGFLPNQCKSTGTIWV